MLIVRLKDRRHGRARSFRRSIFSDSPVARPSRAKVIGVTVRDPTRDTHIASRSQLPPECGATCAVGSAAPSVLRALKSVLGHPLELVANCGRSFLTLPISRPIGVANDDI